MKKIMILTVSAGEGHNSVAKAISNKLLENKENQVELIDLFGEFGTNFKFKVINDGYVLSCRYGMDLFNAIFSKLSDGKFINREKSLAQSTVLSETPKLLRKIYDFKPDVIVVTHVFSSVIITNLRKFYPIPATVVGILTDYMIHPFWECSTGVDYLVSPSEFLEMDLVKKGFKTEQILPFGLPVREMFEVEQDKIEARKELGIDEKLFTIMVMNGGCFGHTLRILKQLIEVKEKVQILLVNGKEEKSKLEVQKFLEQNPNLKHKVCNYGFVKNISTFMSASDCLVGKCGCISINESLNKKLPLIATGKLPYQEIKNIEFLLNNGVALRVNEDNSLVECIELLMNNPEIVEKMKQNIEHVRKSSALKDIANFINQQTCKNYTDVPDISNIEDCSIIKQIKSNNKKISKQKKKRKKYLKRAFKISNKNVE